MTYKNLLDPFQYFTTFTFGYQSGSGFTCRIQNYVGQDNDRLVGFIDFDGRRWKGSSLFVELLKADGTVVATGATSVGSYFGAWGESYYSPDQFVFTPNYVGSGSDPGLVPYAGAFYIKLYKTEVSFSPGSYTPTYTKVGDAIAQSNTVTRVVNDWYPHLIPDPSTVPEEVLPGPVVPTSDPVRIAYTSSPVAISGGVSFTIRIDANDSFHAAMPATIWVNGVQTLNETFQDAVEVDSPNSQYGAPGQWEGQYFEAIGTGGEYRYIIGYTGVYPNVTPVYRSIVLPQNQEIKVDVRYGGGIYDPPAVTKSFYFRFLNPPAYGSF